MTIGLTLEYQSVPQEFVPFGFYLNLKEISSSSVCDFTVLNIYRCLTLREVL